MRTPPAIEEEVVDIEGQQQDQHTPLGTATSCISEVAPGVQYGATWTEVEEPPGNRKPKGAINARVNVPFWLPRCPFSFAVWPPDRLQRANCGLQWANCVSCDEPITWRERLS